MTQTASYTSLERNFANKLNKFPFFKQMLKKAYQYLQYKITPSGPPTVLHPDVSIRPISENGGFWGYYDTSPEKNGRYLYHSFNPSEKPNFKKPKAIDIFLDKQKISETLSWNWQQGSMLKWFDDKHFIHNIYDKSKKKYRAVIINIKSGSKNYLDDPVYDIAPGKNFTLTLDFLKLTQLRPEYGYFAHFSEKQNKTLSDRENGIFKIDLSSGLKKLIISIEQLKNFNPLQSMKKARHKVNHIQINPKETRFIFHHSWFTPGGEKFRRLFSADTDGNDLYLLADNGMVSHCCWKNSEEPAGWMNFPDTGPAYYLLRDLNNSIGVIGENVLTEDGHPGFSKCGHYFLTDTYPDKARMSHILLFHIPEKKIIRIGSFLSPIRFFGENRCDLHPRFNPDGSKITFDSTHTGIRNLYEADLCKIIKGDL